MTAKTTTYEQLEERRAALRAQRQQLAADRDATFATAAQALAAGEPVRTQTPDYGIALQALDQAITLVEQRLHEPNVVADYVAAGRAAVQRQSEALHAERAPFIAAVEKAEAALQSAQGALQRVASQQEDVRRHLERETLRLKVLEDAVDTAQQAAAGTLNDLAAPAPTRLPGVIVIDRSRGADSVLVGATA